MNIDSIFRKILPDVKSVTVYPNIEKSSQYNPYLLLLYKESSLTIKSGNPWNPLSPLLESRNQTIIHHHWLEIKTGIDFFKTLWKIIPLYIFMITGGKVVWTVHNLKPHKNSFLKMNKFIQTKFGNRASRILVHSKEAKTSVLTSFPFDKDKVEIFPHPLYEVQRADSESVTNFLNENKIDTPFILMYGQIAPYKKILEVINLFKDQTFPVSLVIAGKVKPGEEIYGKAVIELAESVSNIKITPRFISTDEESKLFTGASACLFNFDSILTSGSILLSHSYQTPIISRDFPSALPETGNVSTFKSDEELISILSSPELCVE